MAQKKNDNSSSELGLPDRYCLIIYIAGTQTIINLDNYPDEQIPSQVALAIDKYGKEKVRLAKIAFLNIQTSIKIDMSS